jgi:hypothetical protein
MVTFSYRYICTSSIIKGLSMCTRMQVAQKGTYGEAGHRLPNVHQAYQVQICLVELIMPP